ncbi:hypothetical protein [Flexibacterium corallicola]|uniref:hypothetical protein n=1 Tax=Flexibacterium corallicola TaxID=3037259 RepID=UPI00286F82D2|nr:hypothetical protein [Pseudovibrio sp. M1P-2-3]
MKHLLRALTCCSCIALASPSFAVAFSKKHCTYGEGVQDLQVHVEVQVIEVGQDPSPANISGALLTYSHEYIENLRGACAQDGTSYTCTADGTVSDEQNPFYYMFKIVDHNGEKIIGGTATCGDV